MGGGEFIIDKGGLIGNRCYSRLDCLDGRLDCFCRVGFGCSVVDRVVVDVVFARDVVGVDDGDEGDNLSYYTDHD